MWFFYFKQKLLNFDESKFKYQFNKKVNNSFNLQIDRPNKIYFKIKSLIIASFSRSEFKISILNKISVSYLAYTLLQLFIISERYFKMQH